MMATGFLGYAHSLKWCENYFVNFQIYFLNTLSISPKLNTILKNNNIEAKFVFENLHLAKSRDKAKEFLGGLAGIYVIINLEDGVSMISSWMDRVKDLSLNSV